MLKTLMKSLLALSLTFGAAQANETSISVVGGSPLPIKNNNIAMVDEHIVIDGVPTDDGSVSGWKVHCTFHFKNETAVQQKVTMGFPFPRNYEFDAGEFPFAPEDEGFKELSKEEQTRSLYPVIHAFTTKVRGAEVKPKEIKFDDKQTEYHNAWIWDVTFAPGETVELINTYEHHTGGYLGSDRWVDYVLKTGKNWKGGKIGRSLLEVRPHIDFTIGYGEIVDTQDMQNGRVVLKKDMGIYPREGVRVMPDGKFKKIVWDLKDFAPDSDLYFRFQPLRWWMEYGLEGNYPISGASGEDSCEKLRITRNSVYAWYGYPFKSADLKSYFTKQWWYLEDPKFDIKKLSPDAQKYISAATKEILGLEKEQGCRK